MGDPFLRQFYLLRRGGSKITHTQTHTHTHKYMHSKSFSSYLKCWIGYYFRILSPVLLPLLFLWHGWSGSGGVFHSGPNDINIKCICSLYHHGMTDETSLGIWNRIFSFLRLGWIWNQLYLNMSGKLGYSVYRKPNLHEDQGCRWWLN